MNFVHIISIEILFIRIWISKSNKKSLVYFEISTSARWEQYKIKCLQKSLTRRLMELNNILKKELKYFAAKANYQQKR